MGLAIKLHNKMDANFLEHTMYDINDALTSILALCDMEQIKSIPKIKKYIERVNNSLNDVRIYQNKGVFNVNHVLNNVIDIINDNFKNKVKIESSLVSINALAKSDQNKIETILLYLLVEIVMSPEENDDLKLFISLHQADKDAQIIIRKRNFDFSPATLKEIDRLRDGFGGKMDMNMVNSGIEIEIRIPLDFTLPKDVFSSVIEKSYNIEMTPKKTELHPVKSFGKV
jgi:hypothetical protein